MSSEQKPQTKKFQKGERTIPTASDKALKYYPAEDEAAPRKVCDHIHNMSVNRTLGVSKCNAMDKS
jgi:hypothetical protein